ncbi:ankyrin repeat domain-containing protein [bacterium]|nr:ankyrin repeat domain-containing protein [bacterium]
MQRRKRQSHLSHLKYLCQAAARSGQLEELKVLLANDAPRILPRSAWTPGCDPWTVDTCSAAARGGHLEVLQWLRSGAACSWNRDTCLAAAKGGHLETLWWARANGCP